MKPDQPKPRTNSVTPLLCQLEKLGASHPSLNFTERFRNKGKVSYHVRDFLNNWSLENLMEVNFFSFFVEFGLQFYGPP